MKRSLISKLRNLSFRSFLLIIIILTIVINEFLVYRIQSWRWPSLPNHTTRDSADEMRLLLVSDPQIIGYKDEPSFPIGTITRYDSDSFLRCTFGLAFNYIRPDVVIFLGDLMDEGSKATAKEYEIYMDRLESIFYPAVDTNKIFIPGDNDIGGEGSDYRTTYKINRFQQNFENLTGIERLGFIDFLKLDLQLQNINPLSTRQEIKKLKKRFTAPLRVVVNHENILPKLKSFVYPLLMEMQPHLLLSGHWHEARHFFCDDCLSDNADTAHWPVHHKDLTSIDNFISIELNKPLAINELMVPTCSYRMGVPNMGYGVAIIDPEGHLEYSVLWLPSRYLQLYSYLIVISIVTVLYVTVCIAQSLTNIRQKYRPSYR